MAYRDSRVIGPFLLRRRTPRPDRPDCGGPMYGRSIHVSNAFPASREARRRLEATYQVGQEPRDVDGCHVLEVRPHDLDAHGQAVARETDRRRRGGQTGQRCEGDPEREIQITSPTGRGVDRALWERPA